MESRIPLKCLRPKSTYWGSILLTLSRGAEGVLREGLRGADAIKTCMTHSTRNPGTCRSSVSLSRYHMLNLVLSRKPSTANFMMHRHSRSSDFIRIKAYGLATLYFKCTLNPEPRNPILPMCAGRKKPADASALPSANPTLNFLTYTSCQKDASGSKN